MRQLKPKIKVISSLPPSLDETKKSKKIIKFFISLIIFTLLIYSSIKIIKPNINNFKVDDIAGKKVVITNCNTKDYIIIGKDKSYSMKLTNNECEANHYEGNISIKNNQIIFNKNITGTVDDKYNIIINNRKFEDEKNNE